MESWESSLSSDVTTTPNKKHPHSLSSTSAIPMISTPEPRQIRIAKPAFASGFDLPQLSYGVCESGMFQEFQKCPSRLPQKYEVLCEFFNAMVNSIRLFRLKRLPSTVAQLSRKIEFLTNRKFTLHHLGQLKHIMPEVIMVKKIRVEDRETNCMKEELFVSLEVDAAVATEEHMKGGGGFSRLKQIFHSRLTDYSRTHDEDDDVPEGDLPQLFYQPKQESEPNMCQTPAPLAVLHTAPSFKRRFSSRALGASVSQSPLAEPSSQLREIPIKEVISIEAKDEPSISIIGSNATPLRLTSTTAKLASAPAKLASTPVKLDLTPAKLASTPTKLASTPAKFASSPTKLASTPAKLASTPARLMSATPALLPPKRFVMSPDHDYTCDLSTKSAKRRALNFDQTSNDIEDQLSQVGEKGINCPAEKRRQELMAEVPKLYDMIVLLFQSMRRSVVTKEELIYKLITVHLDIVDRIEVEKQLELLEEVAPDYISEVHSLSGDTLLRLNKSSSPESLRMKLLEAN
ncbi:CDT1-like protein a, chloroplastic [Beta vulgaris subsp. vulgaris]|uniref:CDT1-like protein a, chloroplastic n=1 Tax=Beta vulgaris subsp. vulgaris TaxID=3555 RepID=UPI0020368270|nr:CDT1-like protein a, chloroplastic [Beta vulgaris subsp. vulgaris]